MLDGAEDDVGGPGPVESSLVLTDLLASVRHVPKCTALALKVADFPHDGELLLVERDGLARLA